MTEIETEKPTNLLKLTNLNFTSGVLLISMPDVFFLVEEQSGGASEAGQVSQPVRACEPGLGDLSEPTAPAYFFVIKVMFIGVVNFGQIQKLRFVSAKIFWKFSTTAFGHLHLVLLTSLNETPRKSLSKLMKSIFLLKMNTNNRSNV